MFVRFRYVPVPPEGKTVYEMMQESMAISSAMGIEQAVNDSHWQWLRAHVTAPDDCGYVYSQDALADLLEFARSRPAVRPPDQMLKDGGFPFRSFVPSLTKTYYHEVKSGVFIIWRNPTSVHLTFEFHRASSWVNLFRLNTRMETTDFLLPDYLTLDVAVLIAMRVARAYENEGHTIPPSRRKKV
jgi:hypothetical protein